MVQGLGALSGKTLVTGRSLLDIVSSLGLTTYAEQAFFFFGGGGGGGAGRGVAGVGLGVGEREREA